MNGSKRMFRDGLSPVAMLAIVVAMVASLPSQNQCSPTASKPNSNNIELRNIANEQGKVVANLAGHLELIGHGTTELSINIHQIYNAMLDDDYTMHRVAMLDNHVYLSISYHTEDGGNSYEFTKIEMSVNNGTLPVGSYTEICKFDNQFVFSLPVDSRYSCQKPLSHQCSSNGKPVASLVLKSFELELDGDQKKIAEREFSKPAWEKSCDHWSGKEQAI